MPPAWADLHKSEWWLVTIRTEILSLENLLSACMVLLAWAESWEFCEPCICHLRGLTCMRVYMVAGHKQR